MQRERIGFIVMLIVSALWIGSAISTPIVYALLMTGNFAVNCPSVVSGFIEHWNEYTLPRRVFAFFMCVEMLCTRAWCIKEFYTVLQSLITDTSRKARLVTIFYMWSSIWTAVVLDIGILAWLFFQDKVCSDILLSPGLFEDKQRFRTLEPICVQASDVDFVLECIHIFNAVFMFAVAIFITTLSCLSKVA
jgi:hypothetical protein